MEFDFPVENFKTPPHPKGITLVGENVRLEPLNVQNHSANLHEANSLDVEGKNWDYLSYGPFDEELSTFLKKSRKTRSYFLCYYSKTG